MSYCHFYHCPVYCCLWALRFQGSFVPVRTFGDSEDCPSAVLHPPYISVICISRNCRFWTSGNVAPRVPRSAEDAGRESQNRRHIFPTVTLYLVRPGLHCPFFILFDISIRVRFAPSSSASTEKKMRENFWKRTLRCWIRALPGHEQPEDAVAEGTPEGRPGNGVLRPPSLAAASEGECRGAV